MSHPIKKTALHQRQAASSYGRDALGLLPRQESDGLAGNGPTRPQLDYFRVYVHPAHPQVLYLEAVRVNLAGLEQEAALDETWYTVNEAGSIHPFDRFTALSPYERATWATRLVEITSEIA